MNSTHFTEYNLNQQDVIMDLTFDSIPVAEAQISYLKSGRFHEIYKISWYLLDFMPETL